MIDNSLTQTTPLYDEHKKCSAKFLDFHGWSMPISYESILKEHQHVRSSCGVFDVSHMGEIIIKGKGALKFLEHICSNNISNIKEGNSQYTLLLNNNGGIIDDLIIYHTAPNEYMLCVNASNTQKDLNWIQFHSKEFSYVEVFDESKFLSQIALQGPLSKETLSKMPIFADCIEKLAYGKIRKVILQNQNIFIAQTGYTGELGYEIYAPNHLIAPLWSDLLAQKNVKPIGLGARDTLRLEVCYPLYGNELHERINPFEVGLSWSIKMSKESFIGKDSLKDQQQNVKNKLIAFQMQDSSIPRKSMKIYQKEKCIGTVTSGSFLPSLKCSGGLGSINIDNFDSSILLEIDIRGKRKKAQLVKKPMYQPRTKA